jgi:hypothetical protein
MYDKNGVRTNTRELRYRELYNRERIHLIEECLRIDPTYIVSILFQFQMNDGPRSLLQILSPRKSKRKYICPKLTTQPATTSD